MNRKMFIRNGVMSSVAVLAGGNLNSARGAAQHIPSKAFNMKFSPDFTIFPSAPKNSVDQLKWGYDLGFRAWECTWLRRMPVSEQERISTAMQKLGMEFGQFVGTMEPSAFKEVTFAGRNKEIREQVLKDLRTSVEVAKRMNTKFVHNVLGLLDPKLPIGFQMANAIELLKRVVEIYEPHGITMVVETMNQRTQPGLFLYNIPQAYTLAKAINSPSLKMLFDMYHVQEQTGNLTAMIDYTFDQIAYFQVGNVPGRLEPGVGEIDFKFLFQHIYDKGYRGFAGLEHGIPGKGETGDFAAIQAYRNVDPKISK